MNGPHIWLAIGAGGAIGAMARHGAGVLSLRLFGAAFPWGTIIVNIAGSFAMGIFIAWLAAREPHSAMLRAFVAVGVLGGFTTFSAFALDAVTLYRDRTMVLAAAYVAASVVLSLAALFAGLAIGRSAL